jgi:hypothetical protein
MKRRVVMTLAGLCCVIALFVVLRAYHTTLCAEYRLVRMNAYEVVIADPRNHIVTSGTVVSFAVKQPYITGYTSAENMAPDTEPVEGYFLIDTRTGERYEGLHETNWKGKLTTIGWTNPKLRKPW